MAPDVVGQVPQNQRVRDCEFRTKDNPLHGREAGGDEGGGEGLRRLSFSFSQRPNTQRVCERATARGSGRTS